MEISFATSAMVSYDTEQAAYIIEKGIYYICVGNCFRNTHIAGAVSLDETVRTCKVRNICGQAGFKERKIPFQPITYEGEEQEKISANVAEIFVAELAVKSVKAAGETTQAAKKTTKIAVRGIIAAVKAAVSSTKALITLAMAGGGLSVFLIIIVGVIGVSSLQVTVRVQSH